MKDKGIEHGGYIFWNKYWDSEPFAIPIKSRKELFCLKSEALYMSHFIAILRNILVAVYIRH